MAKAFGDTQPYAVALPVHSKNMPNKNQGVEEPNKIPVINPAGGTATLDAATPGQSEFQRLLKVLGPGLITGASDDDPSGIATYAIAGAAFGLKTLWMAIITYPMMSSVQYMCAKIGMVSGKGLAGVLKSYYSRRLVYATVLALIVANVINAGADIGAIAAGINLLVPLSPRILVVAVAIIVICLQIWGSYKLIANVFKWLSIALAKLCVVRLFHQT